jgi:hypothetical protein
MLLEAVGEPLPAKHDLMPLKITAIPSESEFSYKPRILKSRSTIQIREPPAKVFKS